MPKGDKTGPQGLGSQTGRAAGYCSGYPVPGYANPTRGFGRGYRRGGRGFGRRPFFHQQKGIIQPSYQPITQSQTPEQEIMALENYQKDLENEKTDINKEMEGVKARITELKSTSKQPQK